MGASPPRWAQRGLYWCLCQCVLALALVCARLRQACERMVPRGPGRGKHGLTRLCCGQRLVSGGQEMSLQGRLSDYCTATSHVIYLVVRFPGVSYVVPPQASDTEEYDVEPAASSAATDALERPANPRIFLRGTVTIPVPERDVHRVVHSLLGSQSQLSEIVSSIAYNQSRQHWARERRGQAVAARVRGQRGRQAPGRRGPAARAGAQRGAARRNSVNVSFQGSEWQSMSVWPQSIDFRAGIGDDFLYDPSMLGDNSADGFRLHYSSGAQRVTSRTNSADDESAEGQDAFLSSLFTCDDDGNHDLDDSYLSAEQTMLAEDRSPLEDEGADSRSGSLDIFNYHHAIGSVMNGEWDGTGVDHYDMQRVRHDDELPLRRMAGKRKYAEMSNATAVPRRSAPRSRNMAPDLPLPPGIRAPCTHEHGHSPGGAGRVAGIERDARSAIDDADGGESVASLCSPNISITLESQPGACPDIAQAPSSLAALEPAASCTFQEVSSAPVCHFEVAPNRRDFVAADSSGGEGEPAGGVQAGRDLIGNDMQSHPLCGVQQAARASGDPLAAAEVIEVDTGMASLSLHPVAGARDAPSPRHVIDASKSGHAVYKTHPQPLHAGAAADVPLDADSPGSVWSQRNSTEPVDKPVKKNQCCSIM